MPINNDVLKKYLLEAKLITEEKLTVAETFANQEGKFLSEILIEKEFLSEEQVIRALAEISHIPFIKLSDQIIPEEILKEIPYKMAVNQKIIVFDIDKEKKIAKVAMADPENQEVLELVKKKLLMEVIPYFTTEKELKYTIQSYNRDINDRFNKLLQGALKDQTKIETLDDASKIVDTIIAFAYQNKASDIHLEPLVKSFLVRYRIDGVLHDIVNLPKEIEELIVSRIKVLANLRTDEHRAAQDGRFKLDLEGDEITLRVSIIPIYSGEKVVLRLLVSQKRQLDLTSLGYSEKNIEVIKNNLEKSHGMILITGPTGSGKTTTLYTVLKILNTREVNISTIEDPIEYRLEGINQIQVNPKADLTFANGLRSLLRQDPDIIMVGEIRDEETASISINAALTGHIVLATLHTNSAAATLPRLLEMGVEGFLVASTVNIAIAQRLIRKICDKCKESYTLDASEVEKLQKGVSVNKKFIENLEKEIKEKYHTEELVFYRGKGCQFCNNTGLTGRTCIVEVLEVSNELKKAILRNESPEAIEAQAVAAGMTTMFVDGINKVINGETTIEEVLRVVRE